MTNSLLTQYCSQNSCIDLIVPLAGFHHSSHERRSFGVYSCVDHRTYSKQGQTNPYHTSIRYKRIANLPTKILSVRSIVILRMVFHKWLCIVPIISLIKRRHGFVRNLRLLAFFIIKTLVSFESIGLCFTLML